METYKFIQDLEKDFADCCGDIFLDNDEYVYDGDIFEKDGETFHLIQMRVYRILELLNEGDRSETYFNDIKIKIWNEILENVKNHFSSYCWDLGKVDGVHVYKGNLYEKQGDIYELFKGKMTNLLKLLNESQNLEELYDRDLQKDVWDII